MENDNITILARIRGVPAQPGTPESEADPNNPNARPGLFEGSLIKRLRDHAETGCGDAHAACGEAADEIERLSKLKE